MSVENRVVVGSPSLNSTSAPAPNFTPELGFALRIGTNAQADSCAVSILGGFFRHRRMRSIASVLPASSSPATAGGFAIWTRGVDGV